MPKRITKILALNPGTRYLGVAVFEGPELKDWRIKTIKGGWSKGKLKAILTLIARFIERYQPHVLAIKKLHRSRSSLNLDLLTNRIKQLSKRRGLKVYQFSIKGLEAFFSPEEKINKRKLSEIVALKHPALLHELNKEKHNKNPYHTRAFEAVALGAVCFHQLDKS